MESAGKLWQAIVAGIPRVVRRELASLDYLGKSHSYGGGQERIPTADTF
jgi:hypothetical protein